MKEEGEQENRSIVGDEEIPNAEELVDSDKCSIEVCVHNLSGLRPIYSYSDVSLKVEFLGECVLETEKLHFDEIIEIGQSIYFDMKLSDATTYDKFISNPLVFTVTEFEAQPDVDISIPEPSGKAYWQTEESILDLEEALLGTRSVQTNVDSKNKSQSTTSKKSDSKKIKEKASKTSKTTKGSKQSQQSQSKIKGSKVTIELNDEEVTRGPQCAGYGVFDLLPLFMGETKIEENITLKGDSKKQLDDRMLTMVKLPRILVTATTDQNVPSGKLMNITIESIYNLPKLMSSSMKFQICMHIPLMGNMTPINFTRYEYCTNPRNKFTNKKYFGNNQESSYAMIDDFVDVKSSMGNIDDILPKDYPRVEYNTLKRSFATNDDLNMLRFKLSKYNCLAMEVYVTIGEQEHHPSASSIKSARKNSKDKGSKGKSDKKKSIPKNDDNEKPEEDYLHLMGFVELCRLMYPGEKRVRVACPLRTFNDAEIFMKTGLKDSFYRPKAVPVVEEVSPTQGRKGSKETSKSGSKKSSVKGSVMDSSKGTKKDGKSADANLQSKLPPPPPPPISSVPVYNEEGQVTFVIVELELQNELVASIRLEDMKIELHELLKEKEISLSKFVKTKDVTEDFYEDTISNLATDIKNQYKLYLESSEPNAQSEEHFLARLQQLGLYQMYLSSVTQAATNYIDATFNYNPNSPSHEYQAFISKVYIDLIDLMNHSVNKQMLAGIDNQVPKLSQSDTMLAFAREATELGAYGLAERYYLQRIVEDKTNSEKWFDYAVFNMHIGNREIAMECAKEALKFEQNHHDSLILYAMILAEKNYLMEAETCILNVVLDKPSWVEGWGALYCIYQRRNVPEGMEIAYEMAVKNLHGNPKPIHDLAWTTNLIPNSVFYRTTCYFISLRLYNEAEIMLSVQEIQGNDSSHEYLHAVIAYYKKEYDHAILHIDNALDIGGCHYSKRCMRGHILAAQNQEECALEEYQKIFELFMQPEENYLYLLYVRSGLCFSHMGEVQKARLSFMQANKLGGSAYTWLCTGVLFYHQHEYLHAEECLMHSNTLDNYMPETWAYLALVNVRLGNTNEAKMCQHEMLKNNLQNEELIINVAQEIEENHSENQSENH